MTLFEKIQEHFKEHPDHEYNCIHIDKIIGETRGELGLPTQTKISFFEHKEIQTARYILTSILNKLY